MICTTLNHLHYDRLLSIGFLISTRRTYSRKNRKIFYFNSALIFPVSDISRRNMFDIFFGVL